jgi:hypothetical protein
MSEFERGKQGTLDVLALAQELGLVKAERDGGHVNVNMTMAVTMAVCSVLTGNLHRVQAERVGLDPDYEMDAYWQNCYEALPPEVRSGNWEETRDMMISVASIVSAEIAISLSESVGVSRAESYNMMGERWRGVIDDE